MALSLEQKKAVVAEVAEVATHAHSAIAAEYIGLGVDAMTALRVQARAESVYMRVVKNSLARRAFKGTEFECMTDSMTGPLILAFSQEDPGAAARVVDKFSKENSKLVVKLVSIGGKLLAPEDIKRLANMPTKDQAISMLMSVMIAPVTKLARTLAEPHAKLVRTIAAVRDQKEAE
ncbi:MAG: 50S ribosomal protein L10 [Thiohalomonadales bacterium]